MEAMFPKINEPIGCNSPSAGPSAPHAPCDEEAPPPYTTLPRSPGEASGSNWTGPGGGASGSGYAPSGVKLGYVDFVPRVIRKRVFKDDEYETFDALVQRANGWLEEHNLTVINCETLQWMGLKTKSIFSDSCAFYRSQNAEKTTKYLQGLRIWYLADVFPSAEPGHRTTVIRSKTFVPLREERYDQLLNRVNDHLSEYSIGGKLISVETIRMKFPEPDLNYRPGLANPNICFWKESADCDKLYVFCIRVFALFGDVPNGKETIGYQDFVPEHDQRNQENEGYEVFSDVMLKASRWVARQQGVRFTNIQSLSVKLKKKGPFEERCVFLEHLCANNRTNFLKGGNKKTSYLRIVRAYFIVVQGDIVRPQLPAVRLTYRTFTPSQLTSATVENAAEYEGMRQLMDRVNQWLQITGAQVFNLETIPVKMTTGGLQLLGPEATFAPNTLTHNVMADRWLYNVRVFLDGEYVEPPGAVSLVVPNTAMLSRIQ